MCEFGGIAQVDAELEDLSGRPEPVVARLSRRTGQKEERWVQLLTGDWADGPGEPDTDVPGRGTRADLTTDLRAVVAELRTEVAELGIRVVELQTQLETLRRDGWSPSTDSIDPVKNWT